MNAENSTLTIEERRTLLEALVLSGALVIAVSPQGAFGVHREFTVLLSSISQVLLLGSAYDLIDSLREIQLTGQFFSEQIEGKDAIAIRREALERCRRATQILSQKAQPEEAAYFKQGLLWACRRAAEAASEGGGLFGRGSVQVTEEESQAIRQIGFSLGVGASDIVVEELPIPPRREVPRQMEVAFSAEEWKLVRRAPFLAAFAISSVSPSGLIGFGRELDALSRSFQEFADKEANSKLMRALMDDLIMQSAAPVAEQTDQKENIAESEPSSQQNLESLRQAASLVEEKTSPEESGLFKEFVFQAAQKVAEAAREGGFLGIGSRQVTPGEQKMLAEIATALGLPPPTTA